MGMEEGEFLKVLKYKQNQPIRLPGLKPRVHSGLILSGAFYPDLKIGVWRRRTYQLFMIPNLPGRRNV
jgi:hypothetical protein